MRKPDSTPLDAKCNCDEPNKCRRYQCGACIESYVHAVSYDDALCTAGELKSQGYMIASGRIAEYATELHYQRRLTKED